MSRALRAGVLLTLLVTLLLAGCGRKGPLQPRLQSLPAAPTELAIRQLGERFLISWNAPNSNEDGSALTDPVGFMLYRLVEPADRVCPECRDPQQPWRSLTPDKGENGRWQLWDESIDPGFSYRYRVVPLLPNGITGRAAVARRLYLTPPSPPGAGEATPLDRLVRLRWQLPTPEPGCELLGYRLYRGENGAPLSLQPKNSVLLETPVYDDYGPQNGTPYRYGLRSVSEKDGSLVESRLSPLLEATPQAGE